MRGVYTAQTKISSNTSAKTLAYITAPSGKCVEIISASVTVSGTTNQQLECALQRISSLGTPTASSITPSPQESADQAAGSTVAMNVTASEPTYSSGVTFCQEQFSSLGGWRYMPAPEERVVLPGSGNIGLRLLGGMSSADVDVNIVFREIG